MPCFAKQSDAQRIAMLRAENRELKSQLQIQINALLVAQAKLEAMESENKRLSRNISLSQKVILHDLDEAKRYRRAIRKERRLRKSATMPEFLSARKR